MSEHCIHTRCIQKPFSPKLPFHSETLYTQKLLLTCMNISISSSHESGPVSRTPTLFQRQDSRRRVSAVLKGCPGCYVLPCKHVLVCSTADKQAASRLQLSRPHGTHGTPPRNTWTQLGHVSCERLPLIHLHTQIPTIKIPTDACTRARTHIHTYACSTKKRMRKRKALYASKKRKRTHRARAPPTAAGP